MPTFRVEALERFIVRTVYEVDADTPQQAEARCKSGQVTYDRSSIEEGDEVWLETVSVEKCETERGRHVSQDRRGSAACPSASEVGCAGG
jgi:hypothetical protein